MLFNNTDAWAPDFWDCHELIVVRAVSIYGNNDQKVITAECLSTNRVVHKDTSLDLVPIGACVCTVVTK